MDPTLNPYYGALPLLESNIALDGVRLGNPSFAMTFDSTGIFFFKPIFMLSMH